MQIQFATRTAEILRLKCFITPMELYTLLLMVKTLQLISLKLAMYMEALVAQVIIAQ